VHEFLQTIEALRGVQFVDAYFRPLERRTVEERTPEKFTFESESDRRAGNLEVAQLMLITTHWERYWYGDLGKAPKKLSRNVIFSCFVGQPGRGRTTTALRHTYALTCLHSLIMIYRRLYRSDRSWPFSLIPKCENSRFLIEQLCWYQPRTE